MSFKKFLCLLFLILNFNLSVFADDFIPAQPVLNVNQIKTGELGYILTVLKGFEPEKIPVKILDIIPQKPGIDIKNYILVKITDNHKLARGMSGSPVYVREKIIGAVAIGWEFSDHTLGLVTPVEDMCRIFNNANNNNNHFQQNLFTNNNLFGFTISGFKNSSAVERLARSLGVEINQGFAHTGNLNLTHSILKPGDAVATLLVWGDVEAAATGTVTLTSKDGRFLGFGHPFLKRGSVNFPSAKAKIHTVINNASFPFKLASPIELNGIITQDREAGIAGRFGIYPQSIAAFFIFNDLDRNIKHDFKFRVVNDEFLAPKLLEGIFAGLAEEAWGRKGQGTFIVNLRLDGKNIPYGWARKNVFFSDSDIAANAFQNVLNIIDVFLTQQFEKNDPVGIRIDVEATEKPNVLIIENIETVKEAKPGESIDVKVKLRLWRGGTQEEKFTMQIPNDATGACELIVRGGGVHSMPQLAIEEGLLSIDSLERLLTEIKALDANNELILELNADELEKAIQQARNKKNKQADDFDENNIPEEKEFLSMTKSRRINEGTLKILNAGNYFIDGEMKRIIRVVR